MVRTVLSSVLLLLFAFNAECAVEGNVLVDSPAQVSVDLPTWDAIYPNTPIDIVVSVTHNRNAKIDPNSFMMSGKKLNATFVKNVVFLPNSPIEVSIYNTTVPGMPAGLQLLPSISVTVGGVQYMSVPKGFEVQSGSPSNPPGYASAPAQPFLKLEPVFTGKSPLYPGQRFLIGYRYIFNRSIDLAEEQLPLLEAKGFKKIGDKQIIDKEVNGVSQHEVVQKMEAADLGKFEFGISRIAGFAYNQSGSGEKVYTKKPLVSEVAPLTLTVLPFPAENKPVSFNGAIGNYDLSVQLASAPTMHLGDKIQLHVSIAGTGEFDTIMPPDLCCQPGFSGYFKMSDLPPVSDMKEGSKIFVVEMSPENAVVAAIPPIEFSFFDASAGTYQTKRSESIPIKILPGSAPRPPIAAAAPETLPEITSESSFAIPVPSSTVPLLFAIAAGLGLIAWQAQALFYKEEQEKNTAPALSLQYFEQAVQFKENESKFSAALELAIKQALVEKGLLQNVNVPVDSIPDTLKTMPYKDLLIKLEQARFAKTERLEVPQMIVQADRLIHL